MGEGTAVTVTEITAGTTDTATTPPPPPAPTQIPLTLQQVKDDLSRTNYNIQDLNSEKPLTDKEWEFIINSLNKKHHPEAAYIPIGSDNTIIIPDGGTITKEHSANLSVDEVNPIEMSRKLQNGIPPRELNENFVFAVNKDFLEIGLRAVYDNVKSDSAQSFGLTTIEKDLDIGTDGRIGKNINPRVFQLVDKNYDTINDAIEQSEHVVPIKDIGKYIETQYRDYQFSHKISNKSPNGVIDDELVKEALQATVTEMITDKKTGVIDISQSPFLTDDKDNINFANGSVTLKGASFKDFIGDSFINKSSLFLDMAQEAGKINAKTGNNLPELLTFIETRTKQKPFSEYDISSLTSNAGITADANGHYTVTKESLVKLKSAEVPEEVKITGEILDQSLSKLLGRKIESREQRDKALMDLESAVDAVAKGRGITITPYIEEGKTPKEDKVLVKGEYENKSNGESTSEHIDSNLSWVFFAKNNETRNKIVAFAKEWAGIENGSERAKSGGISKIQNDLGIKDTGFFQPKLDLTKADKPEILGENGTDHLLNEEDPTIKAIKAFAAKNNPTIENPIMRNPKSGKYYINVEVAEKIEEEAVKKQSKPLDISETAHPFDKLLANAGEIPLEARVPLMASDPKTINRSYIV